MFDLRPPALLSAFILTAALAIMLTNCSRNEHDDESGRNTAETKSARNSHSRAINVLLITLDTFRADRMGCYGYERGRTPHLDRLAREGVQFANVFASAPQTLPSHATLLTGLSPARHGVHDNASYVLSDEWPTLAERFRDEQYRTAAIVSSFQLDPKYGLARGFVTYDAEFPAGLPVYDERIKTGPKADVFRNGKSERRAPSVCTSMEHWLEESGYRKNDPGTSAAPFFVWAHFFDPHVIYDPPPPYDAMYEDAKYPSAHYDGEVTYLDRHIGRVRALLEDRGLYENTLILVIADHGEGLGDKNETYHDQFIYDTTLRVPLLIGGGALAENMRGLVVESAFTEDIFATLLDAAGIDFTKDTDGVALLPMAARWANGRVSERPADIGDAPSTHPRTQYIESYAPMHNACAKLFGLRVGDWKYIHAPTPELYDLATDPGETKNMYAEERARAAKMHEQLEERMNPDETEPGEIDSETRRRLEAIGYLRPGTKRGADPKDEAEFVHGLHGAMMSYTMGDFDAALRELRELERKAPGRTIVYDNIGTLLVQQGRFEELATEFTAVTARHPDYANGLLYAGMGHMQTGNDEAAERVLRRAVVLGPELALAHFNLAAVLARNGWLDEAAEHWRRVTELEPKGDLAADARGALQQVSEVIRRENASDVR